MLVFSFFIMTSSSFPQMIFPSSLSSPLPSLNWLRSIAFIVKLRHNLGFQGSHIGNSLHLPFSAPCYLLVSFNYPSYRNIHKEILLFYHGQINKWNNNLDSCKSTLMFQNNITGSGKLYKEKIKSWFPSIKEHDQNQITPEVLRQGIWPSEEQPEAQMTPPFFHHIFTPA